MDNTTEIRFPEGLPGFENCGRFVLTHSEEYAPIHFLQAVTDVDVSLPVLPVQSVDVEYRLMLSDRDREVLELNDEARLGEDIVCLVVLVLSGGDEPPACNLMAPIVMNPKKRVAKQVLQIESDYPSVFSLETR